MKNMKMLLLAGSILPMFQINVQAAETECVEAKDCAEMGYTVNVADCVGPALKCPWDLTKAKCKTSEVFELPESILYGDGTVSKDVKMLEKKTPIGVVIDEEKSIAVALLPIKKDGTPGYELMQWSSVTTDVPALTACDDTDTCGTDGRANTDIILKQSGTYYAAQACNKYEPAGCTAPFCKKGKWWLPSYKEGKRILWGSKTDVLQVLAFIGQHYFKDIFKTRVPNRETGNFHTSTKKGVSAKRILIWDVSTVGGITKSVGYDSSLGYVYPVVKY